MPFDKLEMFLRESGEYKEYTLRSCHTLKFPLEAERALLSTIEPVTNIHCEDVIEIRQRITLFGAGSILTAAFRFATLAVRRDNPEHAVTAMWLLTIGNGLLDERDIKVVALTAIHAFKSSGGSESKTLVQSIKCALPERKRQLDQIVDAFFDREAALALVRVVQTGSGADSVYVFGSDF